MKEILKILMLEDSVGDAGLIQYLLLKEKLNCEFAITKDKDDFLLALDEFHPDIILSDHSLPQFNSVDALAIARQKFPGIPFILVTGTASEEFAASIIKLGADDYILKDRMARLPATIIATLQQRKFKKEKQEAEQKIKQSEINLRTIFENTSEGFLLLDNDGTIRAFNNKAREYVLFSKVKEFQIGQSVYEFIEESRKELFGGSIKKAINGESIQYDRSFEMENGNTTWIDFSLTPVIEAGQVRGVCITGRNITEKKLLEQEILEQKIQEQKKIARAIIKAQEEERNYIGQELHDNVNQILVGIKLHLVVAGKNEKLKELIKYPIKLLDSTIQEIRLLSSKLVTPLKDINLKELIQFLLADLSKSTAIKTTFEYNLSGRLISDDLKLNMFRIIQEQFNNVVKHAAAKKVCVSVQAENGIISMVVEDDGRGIDLNKKRKGIGISNIINRVESYNGEVEIISSPGNGCKINVTIPYNYK